MNLATLFHSPTAEELNTRSAFTAALACFGVAVVWLAVAVLLKKKDRKLELPRPFWYFAGSSVGLFLVGVVGVIVVSKTKADAGRLEQSRFREHQPKKAPNHLER